MKAKSIRNSVKGLLSTMTILLILLFFKSVVYAQTPDFKWTKRAAGTHSDYGRNITIDESGKTLVTGYFWSSAIFDTDMLTSVDTLIAKYYAKKLMHAQNAEINYFDTFFNKDGSPHAHIFKCESEDTTANHKILTIAIGADRRHFPLLFYYFDEPLYRHCSNLSVASDTSNLAAAWAVIDSVLSGDQVNSDSTEVIIIGVPNYHWYLNCWLTSITMIIGFWNDQGYNQFIPGGDSNDGFYWAVTEEFNWLGGIPANRGIPYYTKASEYGNNVRFSEPAISKEWYDYKFCINNYQEPLVITWHGSASPYGDHSTVGVGYKEIDYQRFFILHDTWVNSPAYINYNQYFEWIYPGILHYYPTYRNFSYNFSFMNSEYSSKLGDAINLNHVTFQFDPPLNPATSSYHCFEGVDINSDNKLDLVICDHSGWKELLLYYNQNGKFIKDENFFPTPTNTANFLHIVKAGDFDGDGDLDVAVTGDWSPLRIFANQDGTLINTPIIVDDQYIWFTYLDWGDYDRDGDLDLAASTVNGKIKVYRNDNGSFVQSFEIGSGQQYLKIKFYDLNGDLYPELLASDRNASVVAFSNTNGSFSGSLYFSPSTGHGALTFDVADIDADGFPEIVTVDDGKLTIFNNNGGDLDTTPVYLNPQVECYAKDLLLNDLDGDGFPELIVGNYNRKNAIFRNIYGQFEQFPFWISSTIEPTIRVHVYDIQNDGKKEIVFVKPRGGQLEFYEVEVIDVYVTFDFQNIGWYMISLPVAPPDASISTLFHRALGSTAYEWIEDQGAYGTVTKLQTKNGYWIAIPDTLTEIFQGIPMKSYSNHYNQGWHMIGSVIDTVDFTNPNDQPDGSVLTPAYRYDTASGQYVPTDNLIPGQGYWIAVVQECDLTIGEASSSIAKSIAQDDREAFYLQFGSQPPPPPAINWQTGAVVKIPDEFALLQNYPNPFNALTTIKYQLPKGGKVTLQIYDVMGRLVRNLVNTEQPAGYYELRWDGKDDQGLSLPSGLYFYRIQAGEFLSVKKLLLLK